MLRILLLKIDLAYLALLPEAAAALLFSAVLLVVGAWVPVYFALIESRSWRMATVCSRSLNWASCATNVVPSIGLAGFWFFNWETSSVRNVDSFASGSAAEPVAAGELAFAGV
jgi:hypothetical protein